MIYPEKSISDIAQRLIDLLWNVSPINPKDAEEVLLLSKAWKERTGKDLTVKEMLVIEESYNQTKC